MEKSVQLNLKIDFNQALDARLVDEENSQWLAKCKWLSMKGTGRYIRFSCDHYGVIEPVKNAIKHLRNAGYSGHIFIYFLAKEIEETLDRIYQITSFDKKTDPFVMPYRNLYGDGQIADNRLKDLARWCNIESVRKSCTFAEYKRKF